MHSVIRPIWSCSLDSLCIVELGSQLDTWGSTMPRHGVLVSCWRHSVIRLSFISLSRQSEDHGLTKLHMSLSTTDCSKIYVSTSRALCRCFALCLVLPLQKHRNESQVLARGQGSRHSSIAYTIKTLSHSLC